MSRVPRLLSVLMALAVLGPAQALTPAQQDRYDELSARPIHQFKNADLAEYLDLRELVYAGSARPEPAAEIGKYALKGLETPFRLNAGRFALCEADCVSFVERTIALALATDWDSYYLLCERLRHKQGNVAFLERNFFTLADWLPNNAWLLRDVTQQLGVPATSFEYAVFRRQFYERLQFGQDATPAGQAKAAAQAAKVAAAPEKEVLFDFYISRDNLPSTLPALRTGDICLVIRSKQASGLRPWLYCDHMLVAVKQSNGQIVLNCGSPPHARGEELMSFLARYDFVVGLKIVRLRDDARERVAAELRRVSTMLEVPSAVAVDGQVGSPCAMQQESQ